MDQDKEYTVWCIVLYMYTQDSISSWLKINIRWSRGGLVDVFGEFVDEGKGMNAGLPLVFL